MARYIEKFGTGTLMMIRECRAHALPEPDFVQRAGELVTTIWRDWLTEKVIAELDLNERQRDAIVRLKTSGKISNPEYRQLHGISKPTASRDLEDLRKRGILIRVGSTGKGTYYVLKGKGLTMGSMGSSEPKGSQWAQMAHGKAAGPGIGQPLPISVAPEKRAKNAPNAPPAQPQRKRATKGPKGRGSPAGKRRTT